MSAFVGRLGLIDKLICQVNNRVVVDLDVIDEPTAAVIALEPIRAQILEILREPGSATTIATRTGHTRQQVNYHLRLLEAHGLVRLVEERPRRGLLERVMIATAHSYVVASTIGEDTNPARVDRLSTRYLVAVAARMVREVSELARLADKANKPLAMLAIDTEIKFSTAEDRAAFAAELSSVVASLATRYHDEQAPSGRWHRVVVAAHPFSREAEP